jgi:hypothetical protein
MRYPLLESDRKTLSLLWSLLIGTVATKTAALAVYPFDFLKTKIQLSKLEFGSVKTMISRLVQTNGLLGMRISFLFLFGNSFRFAAFCCCWLVGWFVCLFVCCCCYCCLCLPLILSNKKGLYSGLRAMWFGISVEKFTKIFVSDIARRMISEDPYASLMWKDLGAGLAVGVVQVPFVLILFDFLMFIGAYIQSL